MVPLDRIIALISFLWSTIFTFYYTRVRPQCNFSILERMVEASSSEILYWYA